MITHLLKAVILGIVQGITEPLPVSSTAHLVVIEKLFGLDKQTYGLSFDMFINIGTTTAVICFFWPQIKELFHNFRLPGKAPLSQKEMLPWWIIAATIPVGLVGVALEKRIESDFRTLPVIAASLALVGIVMIVAERRHSKLKQSERAEGTSVMAIGLSQILALIPGVSRSGITISTGLFLGLDRVEAAQYSFLLAIPITVAAIAKRLVTFSGEVMRHTVSNETLLFYGMGALASGITAYLTLRFLLKFYSRYSLTTFAYYRILLSLAIVFLMLY